MQESALQANLTLCEFSPHMHQESVQESGSGTAFQLPFHEGSCPRASMPGSCGPASRDLTVSRPLCLSQCSLAWPGEGSGLAGGVLSYNMTPRCSRLFLVYNKTRCLRALRGF